MLRNLVMVVMILGLAAQVASAQDWAKKMFNVTSHDFGVVARGANAEYAFEVQNLYEEEVHIAAVRSSCGCTTPKITKQDLKSWEKSEIIAVYNTRSFLGKKSATLTVVIDKPYYAEVQLNVTGFIRSDVVFSPGMVDFGTVDQGQWGEAKVAINYAGREDWRILDVRSANTFFEVALSQATRSGGRVDYEMLVRLKPDTPAGYLHDQLIIITDDQQMQSIPLPVEGRVISPLTVSPASLVLGNVQPGQTVQKQLVVRGNQPFRILNVKCDDDCFQFKTTDDVKQIHLVPVTFTAGSEPGQITKKIQIETDLGQSAVAQCIATATIKEADPTE